jgi:tetratricopeptide (TPR) repeat protein/tRNA A-37 threonylcarbamoyl transferase component Bud32
VNYLSEIPPKTLVDRRYEVVKTLGQGGFGRTYLVKDERSFEDFFVLKEFVPQATNEDAVNKSRELFEREAKVLNQLEHPQIPKFYGWFKEGERLFLVQEFVDGKTFDQILTERQEQNQAFNELEVIQLLKDVLPVLQYIHDNRIIHRDLSPDNIMLCHQTNKPILIDFGVVNQRTETLASGAIISGGTTVGKQLYSPLEQITAGICYPNSDLYALAVTVLNLLTGKSPIELRDNYDGSWRWRKHVKTSDSFGQMIDKMLSQTSKERYQTAQEVLDELNKFTNSVPVGNSQHSPSKQNDRDRVFSSLLILGGVATIAILGGLFFWQAPNISGLCDALNNCSIDNDDPTADKDHKQAIKPIKLNPNHPPNPNEAQTYYDKGLADRGKQKYQAALSNFSQAIKLNPGFAKAYKDRGNVYLKLKNYQSAIADYDQAIKLNPSFAAAYNNRGNVYLKLKNYQAAITDYNQTIKLAPSFAGAYNNRGITYAELKNYQAAIADYDQAIILNPSDADTYRNRGDVYAELKNYQAAIANFSQADKLNSNPNDAKAYYAQGLAEENYQAAISNFSQAIKLDPLFPGAYNDRGIVYVKLKNYQAAIADFSQVIKLNPSFAGAYNNRGITYAKLKNHQAAIADFSQAIKLNPSFAKAYMNRGIAYADSKDYQAAIADFSQVIKLNPSFAEAYIQRGIAYADSKDYQAAIADFSQVIKLNPYIAEAYIQRGIIYQKQQKFAQALSDYTKALTLKQNDFLATTNIGLIKYEIGAIEEAKKQFQQAINLDNKSAKPQLALAVTLYSLGESEKAIAMAKTALSIDKKFADPKFLKENLWGEKLIADTEKLLSHTRPHWYELLMNSL